MEQHLLAWTRVTSSRIHLWTYYWMLKQLNDLSYSIKVSFILCDLQSWDLYDGASWKFSDLRDRTLNDLWLILSDNIDIYVESDIPRVAELGLEISRWMTKSMINRISAVKWKRKTGEKPSVSTVLYPSMMTANMLAVGANCLFNRPETNFQPVDLMNELVRKTLWREAEKFATVEKKEVKIPAADWWWIMSRVNWETRSVIEIVDTDKKHFKEQLLKSCKDWIWEKSIILYLWKLEFWDAPIPWDIWIEDVVDILSERIFQSIWVKSNFEYTKNTWVWERVEKILKLVR